MLPRFNVPLPDRNANGVAGQEKSDDSRGSGRLASRPVKSFRSFRFNCMAGLLLAIVALAAAGCFSRRDKSTAEKPSAFTIRSTSNTNVVFTPAPSAIGRVASVNQQARFVVLNFPVGQLPPADSRLAVFRSGTKTGELRVTGPAQDTFTVADLLSGSAQEGDEARAE
jgi:hypothetical protein